MSDNASEGVTDGLEKELRMEKGNTYPLEKLGICLQNIKKDYPASDTVIIIPGESIIYETIIQTMDIARYSKETPMFPKVVLSGKVG